MLKTEERNPNSTHIDTMTFPEMMDLMARENPVAVEAVAKKKDAIAAIAEAVSLRMRRGGRLFYVVRAPRGARALPTPRNVRRPTASPPTA